MPDTSTQSGREARMRQLEEQEITKLKKKFGKNRNLGSLLQDKTGSGDNIPGGFNDPFDYPKDHE